MLKEGIDSFPLDCHTNENLSEIEAEYGIKGFAVIVRFWQKIYSEKGYYCEWTERSPVLFLSTWFGGNSGVDINFIREVVNAAFRVGIFDRKMYEDYSILTSNGIQKRYFEIAKRRTAINVVEEYLLVEDASLKGNVCKTSIFAYKTKKNVSKNEVFASQRKGKERKGKERKTKEGVTRAREDTPPPSAPKVRPDGHYNSLIEYDRENAMALIETRNFPKGVENAVKEWIRYKEELGTPYFSAGINALAVSIARKIDEIGDDAVCQSIEESMSNNWKSIVFDRVVERNGKKKQTDFSGTGIGGYDWDAIRRSLDD